VGAGNATSRSFGCQHVNTDCNMCKDIKVASGVNCAPAEVMNQTSKIDPSE